MSTATLSKACVTGCDRNFVAGARAMLQTVRRYHPEVTRYLLTKPDDVGVIQDALGDLARVLPFPRPIRGVPAEYLPSYARLFIPDLFSEDVVAWVDSDAIFTGPAARLWDVPPGRVHAGPNLAFPLWPIGKWLPAENWDQYARLFLGVQPDDPGFNAGVMAFRPADWAGLLDRFEQAVEAIGFTKIPFVTDQTVLNGLFFGRVDYLPPQYNFHCFLDPSVRTPADVKVVQYAGAPKPWQPEYPRLHPGYYHWERATGASAARLAVRRLAVAGIGGPLRLARRSVRKLTFRRIEEGPVSAG